MLLILFGACFLWQEFLEDAEKIARFFVSVSDSNSTEIVILELRLRIFTPRGCY